MGAILRTTRFPLAAVLMIGFICAHASGAVLASSPGRSAAAPGPTATLDATARGFARAVMRYRGKDATVLSYLTPGLAAKASRGRIFALMGISNNPSALKPSTYKLSGMAGAGRFARLTITWVFTYRSRVTSRVVDHTIWIHTGFGWRLNAVSHGR